MPAKPATLSAFPTALSRALGFALNTARRPLRVPRLALFAAVALIAVAGFVAGRSHPAHHYVAYFGYPMVLDTTTGKACYAVAPRPAEPAPVQDAAFPIDGADTRLDSQAPAGPQIPLCGK
jgi:hypothetical protein